MVIIKEANNSMPASLKDYVGKIDEMIRQWEELKMTAQKFKGFNPKNKPFEVFVRSIDYYLKELKKDVANAKDIVSKQPI